MFRISKTFKFEAAHYLPHHDGKCARLHGHSWLMRVTLASETLQESGPKTGMLMDYADVTAAVRPLLEGKLDHYCLNDTLPLENPTSEAVAEWAFQQLQPLLPGLTSVEIEETCTASACYWED